MRVHHRAAHNPYDQRHVEHSRHVRPLADATKARHLENPIGSGPIYEPDGPKPVDLRKCEGQSPSFDVDTHAPQTVGAGHVLASAAQAEGEEARMPTISSGSEQAAAPRTPPPNVQFAIISPRYTGR
jgi:hypothetical protein